MWYGKGPGVDRTGDVFKHGNLAGTSQLGGVLVLMGDDHTCESSTTAHQSEFALVDAQIPVLNPAGVAEILEFGLMGFALSRYSGCWVGLKCDPRHGQHRGLDRARPGRDRDRHARVRAAAGRPQHPLARPAARPGGAPAPLQARGGARIRRAANRFDRLVFDSPARGSASSRPASPTSICARRSTTSASTGAGRSGSGCGS